MTPDNDLKNALQSETARDALRRLGKRFDCVIHIARVIGKKRWAYVAGDTQCDMLSVPLQRVNLDDGFGAILYPRRPIPQDRLTQIIEQLNTFLENVRRL
jgi:hypothetical protein